MRLWKSRWRNSTLLRRCGPGLALGVYAAILLQFNAFRQDHALVFSALLLLFYGGPRTDLLLKFALPFALTGFVYDALKYVHADWRGPVRISEPYLFDLRFFGISDGRGGYLTPNEWWQLRTHPALDLIAGFFYFTFIPFFALTAAYLLAFVTREAIRMPWAFFAVNLIGYSTYFWYPAAPPWYVSLYGLGPLQPDVAPYAAGALRFDELLGIQLFSSMYAKGSVVFGAIPSLHISYPLIAMYYAFRFGAARIWTTFFYGVMCFAAVYLNHHYVLDILWGSAYALVTCATMDKLLEREGKGRMAAASAAA